MGHAVKVWLWRRVVEEVPLTPKTGEGKCRPAVAPRIIYRILAVIERQKE